MTRPPGLRAAANLIRLHRHKMLAHEDLKNAQVLIFANKQDVKEALTSAEISKSLNLTKLKGISWHIQVAVLNLNWTLGLLVTVLWVFDHLIILSSDPHPRARVFGHFPPSDII